MFSSTFLTCSAVTTRIVFIHSPYVGAGVALSWSEPHQQNLGINAGLINRFRVSDAWDINLELRGLLMKDAFGGT